MGVAAGSLKIHKINKTDKSLASLRKKGSGLKSIELEMKKLQLMSKKYKRS